MRKGARLHGVKETRVIKLFNEYGINVTQSNPPCKDVVEVNFVELIYTSSFKSSNIKNGQRRLALCKALQVPFSPLP